MRKDVLQFLTNQLYNTNNQEFIEWAKSYNIFQDSKHKGYLKVCTLIRERCLKDNIDIELLRP